MFQIMVVEDDKSTARLTQTVLSYEGYQVHLAENGEEALELLDRQHIDMIVLDIMMPKMDGYKFAETLRAADQHMPILMVSVTSASSLFPLSPQPQRLKVSANARSRLINRFIISVLS